MLWIAATVRAFLYVPRARYLLATSSGTNPACQSFATNTTSSPYVPVNPFADAPSPKSITSGASHAACDKSVKRNWLSPYPPSASPYSRRSFVRVVLDKDEIDAILHLVHVPHLVKAAEALQHLVRARVERALEQDVLLLPVW